MFFVLSHFIFPVFFYPNLSSLMYFHFKMNNYPGLCCSCTVFISKYLRVYFLQAHRRSNILGAMPFVCFFYCAGKIINVCGHCEGRKAVTFTLCYSQFSVSCENKLSPNPSFQFITIPFKRFELLRLGIESILNVSHHILLLCL